MMAMVTVIAGRETTFKPLLDAALRRGLERAGLDPALAAGALERCRRCPRIRTSRTRWRRCAPAASRSRVLTQSAVDAAEAVLAQRGPARSLRARAVGSGLGRLQARGPGLPVALEQAGATDAWFVAGHWWDVAGAAYAGLRTAWISRTDLAYPDAMPAPDVAGPDLASVAAAHPQPHLNGVRPSLWAVKRARAAERRCPSRASRGGRGRGGGRRRRAGRRRLG